MEIKRDVYLNQLIEREKNGLVKIITGIRRCGKSYLLFNIFHNYLTKKGIEDNHIIEVALDDRTNIELRDPDKMLAYVKERIEDEKTYYIILDEVQFLKEFEDVLNSFLHIRNADVYVTGSNSKFLSSDVITEFRGRGDEIRIHPLSFSEFITAYGNQGTDEAWDDYVNYGGLPLVLSYRTARTKGEYLSTQFKEVYMSDIVDRHHIRNKEEMDELVDILASAIGSLTNPLKLSKVFRSVKKKNISDKTLKTYIGYLQDSFMISKAVRFDIKGKKYINSPAKYYFEDIGLRNARLNFRQNEENHIMENLIYNELCYRGFSVDVGVVTIFGKDKNGRTLKNLHEVDFVATRGSQKYYIQSAFRMNDQEKITQEQKSLININDSFKKIIVVGDNIKARRSESGIMTIGMRNFLLDENSLEL